LRRILDGGSDANFRFSDLRRLLTRFGFQERIRDSHHIFYRDCIAEIINIQPEGSQAKRQQVRQIRELIFKYRGWEWLDV
jgi:hypothetical protein